jgi:hypothetical protein
VELYHNNASKDKVKPLVKILEEPTSNDYQFSEKLKDLLSADTKLFNRVVFEFLQNQNYPISNLNIEDFPLVEDDSIIKLDDVFNLFEDNGVRVPAYYDQVEFEVNGEKGTFNRTRSGCYFCFYQKKIEWIWLYERHRKLFEKAMEYEKDGYTWMEDESLSDIIQPERMKQIKEEHLQKIKNKLDPKSNKLIDILDDEDSINCANCFI